MDTNPQIFYDLMSRAFRGDTSSRRLQAFIDTTLSTKYNGLNINGFPFAEDMQIEFTYEQMQKEFGITAMANYYDIDSPAVPRGEEGIALNTGSIPRMKDVIYFNEDKVRKQLIVDRMYGADSDEAVRSAKMKLFSTIDSLVNGHTNSLKYQRDQMVSNRKLSLTSANNPKGITGVTFSASVPSANITNASAKGATRKWWTDKGTYANEGADANPVDDICEWLRPILDRQIKGHLEVNAAFLRRVLRHSKVVRSIALNLWPTAETPSIGAAAILSEEKRRSVFEEIIGIRVDVNDDIVAVEKYDKTNKKITKTNINAFESDVFVFVPEGNIGETLTVMPITFKSSAARYAQFYGGKLLITVEQDAVLKCQGFHSEMTSLTVPTAPQYMFYFHPND